MRDLKRALDRPRSLSSSASLPQLVEALHPDIGRPRDIATPGGFRRNHMQRTGSGALSAVETPLLATSFMDRLLDPRVARCCALEACDGDVAALTASAVSGSAASTARRIGSSDVATAFLILKSTVGGTLILIPGGFKDAGLLSASLILCAIGGIEIYCMSLLVRCNRALGGGSYGDIVCHCVGRSGRWLVDLSLVLSQLGFVCAEMLYVGKNLHSALEKYDLGWLSETHILLLQLVISVPASWIRRLDYFKWTNVIANVTVLFALGTISASSVVGVAQHGPSDEVNLVSNGWLLFMGTSVFSFECINFVIPMYEEHEKKESFVPVLSATLCGVIVLFVGFGAVNYASYGEATASPVTLNLPHGAPVGKIVPFAFALASLLNIPLFLFPATITIEAKVFPAGPPTLCRKWQKNGVRTGLILLCTGIAIVGAQSIQAMVSLIGSLCCVPLAFIYPAISHYILCKPGVALKIVDVAVAVLGAVLFVSTTTDAIKHMQSVAD